MNDENLKEIEEKVSESIKDATTRGMAIGAKTMSQVIYNKSGNVNRHTSKGDMYRIIKEINKFCEIGLGINPNSKQDK